MTKKFKRGWINLNINMGLNSFKNYINELENFLSSQHRELEEEYKQHTKNMDSEEAQYIYEYQYDDQFHYIREEFPNILHKSFIVSIYSFLEQELNNICLHIEKNSSFKVPNQELRNENGIFNSYKFLKEVANVNVKPVSSEWEKIKQINKIRNHIVHNGNDILDRYMNPKSIEEIRKNQTLRAFEFFRLAEEDKNFTKSRVSPNETKKYDIKFTRDFCEEALNIFSEFFDKITNIVKLY